MNFGYKLDLGYVLEHIGDLAAGTAWTVVLTAIGILGGTALGLIGGLVRAYRVRVLSPVVGGCVEAIRTTPLFVQIFFLYFGLPEIGITAPALAVATIALVIWGAAYNTENFRAAIEAVPPGFHEAARALGFKPQRMFLLVTAPIAIRIAMPSVTNTSIETLKNSALMVAISFPELTDVAVKMVAVSFRVFEVFTTIAITYLVLTMLLTYAMRVLERRMAWPV